MTPYTVACDATKLWQLQQAEDIAITKPRVKPTVSFCRRRRFDGAMTFATSDLEKKGRSDAIPLTLGVPDDG